MVHSCSENLVCLCGPWPGHLSDPWRGCLAGWQRLSLGEAAPQCAVPCCGGAQVILVQARCILILLYQGAGQA